MIDLSLTFDEEPEPDSALNELYRWLERDDELRPVRKTLVAPPLSGEDLGVIATAIELIFENKELITGIFGALSTWLATRGKRTVIKVRRGDDEVMLDSTERVDAAKAAQTLLREL